MFEKSIAETTVQRADKALDSAQSAAEQALNGVSSAIDSGVDRVREATHRVRDNAQRAAEGTTNYIRQDPLKSVLIAAATGAALMALVSLITRSSSRD